MTEIWLARHGETDWNRVGRLQGDAPVPLNARGRAQATSLAATLRDAAIGAVFASDLPRAVQTAAIVARVLRLLPAAPDPRLRERALGPFQGLTYAEAAARAGRSLNAAGWLELAGLPGVEDDAAVLTRLLAAFADIAAALPDGRALAVSHGSAMAALARGLGGGPAAALHNAAVLRLRGEGADWRLA